MVSRQNSHLATELIESTGQRVTRARAAVLGTLLSAEHALSHQEIEGLLAKSRLKVDRVTLYRVLHWLLDHALVHKVTGEDRVWRFSARANGEHTHLSYSNCGHIYCIDHHARASDLNLPEDVKLQHADIAVQGLCPSCEG